MQPAKDGASPDIGILAERDQAKDKMGKVLEALAKEAYDAGLEAAKQDRVAGDNQKEAKAANELMREAFLNARLTKSDVKPSELMAQLRKDAGFLKRGGKVEDTGLHALNAALGEIF